MKPNYEMFEKVKQAILNEPAAVNMSQGVAETHCGTVGCVAGHACMLGLRDSDDILSLVSRRFGIDLIPRDGRFTCSWLGVIQTARALLGIDFTISDALFYFYDDSSLPRSGNKELAERLLPLSHKLARHPPGSKKYAEVVAEAIDVTVAYLKEKYPEEQVAEKSVVKAATAAPVRKKKQIHVHVTE